MKKHSKMENGFVKFASRNWRFAGDKQTWARVDDGKLTVAKAARGIISSAYRAELVEFCATYGIDFAKLHCGSRAQVEI